MQSSTTASTPTQAERPSPAPAATSSGEPASDPAARGLAYGELRRAAALYLNKAGMCRRRRDRYNARRYLACARRWRERAEVVRG